MHGTADHGGGVACQSLVVYVTRGGSCARNRTALSLQACNVRTWINPRFSVLSFSGSSKSKQLWLQCPSCTSARWTAKLRQCRVVGDKHTRLHEGCINEPTRSNVHSNKQT